jgi:hypothetical protein
MGYSVAVERVKVADGVHVYWYGREGVLDGYFAFDASTGVMYPCDRDGLRIGTGWVSVEGEENEVAGRDSYSWYRFIEAAAGVILAVRVDPVPPQTAHRFFG